MTTKFILPGSIEIKDNGKIVAGIFVGKHEWDINDTLRYIEYDKTLDKITPKETLIEVMSKIYDNSTGCLIHHTFKRNG